MSGFEKVMGHAQAVAHLENAIKQNKVSHAYIFNGEKGCGKKMLALEFARMLQCQEEGRPCGKCRSCLQARAEIIRTLSRSPMRNREASVWTISGNS